MKKNSALILAILMVFGLLLTSCAKQPGAGSTVTGSGVAGSGAKPGEGKTIALVCDVAGTQVFVNMMIEGLNEAAKEYGFTAIVVECADSAAYEDNIRALVEEDTDLIIVGGWQGGEALDKIAKEFPDKADYALIDSEVEAENVKSISYREQEGAYLVGMMAASVVGEDDNVFGAVHVSQGPGSWKWRYGYMEGVKSIKPDATFLFNYVGGYNDPALAKENAILQYEQGAKFINAAAAGGDIGVFEAAKELGFYTSGQDIDLTSPDNPFIITSQIKDTKATIEYLVANYITKEWTTDNEEWGIAEGTIGAVFATHDSPNPMSDLLSAEELAAVVAKAEEIKNGTFDMSKFPAEEDYKQ